MLDKIRIWLASIFLPANLATVLSALHAVAKILDVAIPVVARIDEEVKPALAEGQDSYTVLQKFLEPYGSAPLAAQLSALPKADLLHGAAVVAIEALVPQPIPRSALRLAAEVAYWIYRSTRK